MTNHSQRIQDIKSRAEKATEGPWEAGHLADDEAHCNCRYVFGNDDRMGSVAEISISEREDGSDGDNPPPNEARANLEFIAHARSDVPWLISQLDASLARERDLREALTAIGIVTDLNIDESTPFQRLARIAAIIRFALVGINERQDARPESDQPVQG